MRDAGENFTYILFRGGAGGRAGAGGSRGGPGLELLQVPPACLPRLSPWGGGTGQAPPDPFSRPEGAQDSSQGPKSGCSHGGTFLKIQLPKLLIHFQRFAKTP